MEMVDESASKLHCDALLVGFEGAGSASNPAYSQNEIPLALWYTKSTWNLFLLIGYSELTK
jgi:hypothetical protein